MMTFTLGSLFDGSGGFPSVGSLCGILPRWASEVEPYPIAVTRSRFPDMVHLGDISKVHGGEIEPVDIVTFGSPCQDLSVAGKRAGLKHEANGDEETTRSGLFMEAVRIIKQMREATDGKYPTFALWENVPGAFSSNGGEDFRVVCEELIKIVEPSAVMPAVPEKGWAYADSYVGDGWSLAYRVFDAQYWGVPQRRRRIHLVVDFRGERAREVLFERQGVRGYFAQSGETRQTAAADAERGTGADDRAGEVFDGYNGDLTGDVAATLGVNCGLSSGRNGVIERGAVAVPYTLKIRSGCEGGGKGALIQKDKSATLATNNDQYLFQPVPNLLLDDRGCREVEIAKTLDTTDPNPSKNQGGIAIVECYYARGNGDGKTVSTITGDRPAVAYAMQGFGDYKESDKASGLKARDYKDATDLICGVDCRNATEYPELNGTIQAKSGGGTSLNYNQVVRIRHIVRRLTPTECARLQGFADWWGHIEPKEAFTDKEYRFWLEVRNTHATINGKAVKEYTKPKMLKWYNKLWTDSAEYKMWGNGIALPPALYVMQGMADAIRKNGG